MTPNNTKLVERLTELAERCEQATGPDRPLDGEVWRTVHGLTVYDVLTPEGDISVSVPPLTASIDAAMTLVPEGYDWIIGRTNGGLTIHAEVGGRGDEFQRFGNTPALALCAAALRARA